jgi:hypothetical protein
MHHLLQPFFPSPPPLPPPQPFCRLFSMGDRAKTDSIYLDKTGSRVFNSRRARSWMETITFTTAKRGSLKLKSQSEQLWSSLPFSLAVGGESNNFISLSKEKCYFSHGILTEGEASLPLTSSYEVACFVKMKNDIFYTKAPNLNWSVQGGQMYCAFFPFSKAFLLLLSASPSVISSYLFCHFFVEEKEKKILVFLEKLFKTII